MNNHYTETVKKWVKSAILLLFFLPEVAQAQPVALVTIGTGTTASGTTTPGPFNIYYRRSTMQLMYTAAELQNPLGGNILSLAFNCMSLPAYALPNYTIKIGTLPGTATTLTWVPPASMTTIYNAASYLPTVTGWQTIPITPMFNYNGTDNIVVELCWDQVQPSYSSTGTHEFTTVTGMMLYTWTDGTGTSCGTAGTTTQTARPNIRFEFEVLPNNTGVSHMTAPNISDTLFCSGPQEVKVNVHNYGNNDVNSVNVNWKVNGVLQTPVVYTGLIEMENTPGSPDAEVSLGSWNFPHGVNQNFEVWTSLPNGVQDTKPANDSFHTTLKAGLLGIVNFQMSPQDTTICVPSAIMLDAGEHPKNPIYIWSTSQLTQSIEVNNSGLYWVKVQNTDGCVAFDTINVTAYPNPLVGSIPIIDNGGGNFTFNVLGAAYIDDYYWDFGDGTTPTPPDWTAGMPGQVQKNFDTEGEYTVTLYVRNQCGTVSVTRKVLVGGLGIDHLNELQRAMKVYPNPAQNIVHISNDLGLKINSIVITNILGQTVKTIDGVKDDKLSIDISSFSNGLYSLSIATEKGKVSKKMEILK